MEVHACFRSRTYNGTYIDRANNNVAPVGRRGCQSCHEIAAVIPMAGEGMPSAASRSFTDCIFDFSHTEVDGGKRCMPPWEVTMVWMLKYFRAHGLLQVSEEKKTPIELINAVPPIAVHGRMVACEGGVHPPEKKFKIQTKNKK